MTKIYTYSADVSNAVSGNETVTFNPATGQVTVEGKLVETRKDTDGRTVLSFDTSINGQTTTNGTVTFESNGTAVQSGWIYMAALPLDYDHTTGHMTGQNKPYAPLNLMLKGTASQ